MSLERSIVTPHAGFQTGKATDIVVAIFADHREAGSAIVHLIDVGFGPASISIVGRGFPRRATGASSSRAVAVRHTGQRSTLWSEMETTLLDTHFASGKPDTPVVALGYLAKHAAGFAQSVGTPMALLGAVLSDIGIPGDHVVRYEFAVHANGCLVMAHGDGLRIARARSILRCIAPASVDIHAVDAVSPSGTARRQDRVFSEAPDAAR